MFLYSIGALTPMSKPHRSLRLSSERNQRRVSLSMKAYGELREVYKLLGSSNKDAIMGGGKGGAGGAAAPQSRSWGGKHIFLPPRNSEGAQSKIEALRGSFF